VAGSDCDAAFAIYFAENDQPEPQMIVEYASGGGWRYATQAHARRVATSYLDEETPPRRLIVDRDGNVRPHAPT
jgi:hypothetical protein